MTANLQAARDRVAAYLYAVHAAMPDSINIACECHGVPLYLGDLDVLVHATTPQARARRGDPDTSHAAAASVDSLRDKARGVLTVLWHYGPGTDEQLAGRYALMRAYDEVPEQSPSGLRTRRAELVGLGLVRDTGERRAISTGRHAIVWAAAVQEPAATVAE